MQDIRTAFAAYDAGSRPFEATSAKVAEGNLALSQSPIYNAPAHPGSHHVLGQSHAA
jgi:hypothetical protein